jgi:hypothetical protein
MTERTARKGSDAVTFSFSCKFVTVKRDNEECYDIVENRPSVRPPERRDSVEQEGSHVDSDVPNVLVLITVRFIQSSKSSKLEKDIK